MIRLALYAAVLAAMIGIVGGVYAAGHRAGTAGAELAMAQAVAAERERQQQAAAAALEQARQEAEARAAEAAQLERQVTGFEAELALRPANCPVSDQDAARLDAIH